MSLRPAIPYYMNEWQRFDPPMKNTGFNCEKSRCWARSTRWNRHLGERNRHCGSEWEVLMWKGSLTTCGNPPTGLPRLRCDWGWRFRMGGRWWSLEKQHLCTIFFGSQLRDSSPGSSSRAFSSCPLCWLPLAFLISLLFSRYFSWQELPVDFGGCEDHPRSFTNRLLTS